MPFACKLCIAIKGLRGSDVNSLPKTEDELADHLESEHEIIVRRPDELQEQAITRYYKKFPERAP
jgi:hypothetical protein